MKKIIIILTIAIAFVGCKKEIKHGTYSCSPVIQNYVEQNYESLMNITVMDFGNLTIDTAIAVYMAWSPTDRYNFWYGRIDQYSNMVCMSSGQSSKLNDLKAELNINLFDTIQNGQDSTFNTWMDNWVSSAGSLFTANQLFTIVAIHKNPSGCPAYTNVGGTGGNGSPSQLPCTCSFVKDWCDFMNPSGSNTFYCKATNCAEVSLGCGTLWRYKCGGRCALKL
ncbi:MAG: bacteriocin fulvocin C-related protein [bacterium]|nr:bacteriocin fulvocin C-related protein [bacterium]